MGKYLENLLLVEWSQPVLLVPLRLPVPDEDDLVGFPHLVLTAVKMSVMLHTRPTPVLSFTR